MNKKLFGLMFMFLFAITLVSATYSTGDIELRHETNLTSCNISIAYPNTTLLIDNQLMGNQVGFVNYTFNTNTIGEYNYYGLCGTESFSNSFVVTESGVTPVEGLTLAFFILLFLAISVGTIIITLRYFQRGVNMEMDLSDLVMSYISFFVFLLFYYFAFYYWGNPFVMDLLETSLWVVGFMNLFVASIMVIFNILKRINKGI